MWDYFSLVFWLVIGVIGLALYVYPSFFVQHQYEGFMVDIEVEGYENPVPKTEEPKPEVNTLLRNLEQLIQTPGLAPDTAPKMPSAAIESVHQANTGREQPKESEGKSSKPEPINQPAQPSLVLQQGRVFQESKPLAQIPQVKEIIKERIVHVPVPRTCPPKQDCPVCPDMRNYIRKDSIPCWACKL
jgi:hypothetical protein